MRLYRVVRAVPIATRVAVPAATGDEAAHVVRVVVHPANRPLRLFNVEPFACTELQSGAPAGTYAVAFSASGSAGKAMCEWVRRLSP